MLLQTRKSRKLSLKTEKQMCFTKWTTQSMKVFIIETFTELEKKIECRSIPAFVFSWETNHQNTSCWHSVIYPSDALQLQ